MVFMVKGVIVKKNSLMIIGARLHPDMQIARVLSGCDGGGNKET